MRMQHPAGAGYDFDPSMHGGQPPQMHGQPPQMHGGQQRMPMGYGDVRMRMSGNQPMGGGYMSQHMGNIPPGSQSFQSIPPQLMSQHEQMVMRRPMGMAGPQPMGDGGMSPRVMPNSGIRPTANPMAGLQHAVAAIPEVSFGPGIPPTGRSHLTPGHLSDVHSPLAGPRGHNNIVTSMSPGMMAHDKHALSLTDSRARKRGHSADSKDGETKKGECGLLFSVVCISTLII